MRRLILTIVLFSIYPIAWAQITQIRLQIDGFTCSLCANSVEASLSRLPYVRNIKMSLPEASALILIREEERVDFQEIARSVKQAGFSVGRFDITLRQDSLRLDNPATLAYGAWQFRLVHHAPFEGSEITFRLIGKEFVSRKEISRFKAWIEEDQKKFKTDKKVLYATR